jgi:predicted TIM-barrel fold metal-dependent hydrolase
LQNIFDFHVHIFPDNIAAKATDNLSKYYGVPMYCAGTRAEFTETALLVPQIRKSLIHSTATRPSQVYSVNSFLADIINDDLLGFGTVHPDYEDIEGEIDRIIALGLKGIKLHPDFQRFNADSQKACRIYRYAQGKLPVLFHAGDENFDFSSPKRIRNVHDMFPDLTIIAAHLGGYRAWEDSKKYLVNTDVYFDTSSTMQVLRRDEVVDIIRTHGADKCLFGTDFPMHARGEETKRFFDLGLTEEENKLILWDNAMKLLGLNL